MISIDLPGLAVGRLSGWFAETMPDAGELTSARLVAGGRSNLTYEISDGVTNWILRRPPLGHVVATAHDMSREYRVMSALAHTGVPVPAMVAFCTDVEVLDAPFYLMERVSGTPFRFAGELAALGPERTRTISLRLVDTLAALHQVDPIAVGLADFGRSEGFLARQIRRWGHQFEASHSRPLAGEAHLRQRLSDHVPAPSSSSIVHGDFRLDNVLFDQRDCPAAVLDWEMATLGDPITDLALLVVYQRAGEWPGGAQLADASSAAGFLAEAEIVGRYIAATGRDIPHLGFYLALASYKLAAIVESIYYRDRSGLGVGERLAEMGALTEPLLEAGIAALPDAGPSER